MRTCNGTGETCNDFVLNVIDTVVRNVFRLTELCMVQVWVPDIKKSPTDQCLQSYSHELFFKERNRYSCNMQNFLKDQGIVGKAFATNHPWFSTDVFSIPDTECTEFGIKRFNMASAIAIPLLVVNTCDIPTCRIPDKIVFEFFLPCNCDDFEEQKKQIDKLISTLRQNVKNFTHIERLNKLYLSIFGQPFKYPSFKLVLEPIKLVGQNGARDSLFPKENSREAWDERFLPEPSYQTEQCSDMISSTQPAEVFDAIGQGGFSSMAVRETSLKGATKSTTAVQSGLQQINDKILGVLPEPSYPNAKCLETTPRTEPAEVRGDNISQGSSLKDETIEERHATAINTVSGKTTGSAGSKRDWAWKYCSPIDGNRNGVICSFCGLEIKGGGITRFKSHLSNSDPSKNVKKCKNVPSDVKVETEKRIKRA